MTPSPSTRTETETTTARAQPDSAPAVVTHVQAVLIAGATLALMATLVASLYVLKSAAGINLLPGHSPLHDLLYPLVY